MDIRHANSLESNSIVMSDKLEFNFPPHLRDICFSLGNRLSRVTA